jgi:hypothetical protein
MNTKARPPAARRPPPAALKEYSDERLIVSVPPFWLETTFERLSRRKVYFQAKKEGPNIVTKGPVTAEDDPKGVSDERVGRAPAQAAPERDAGEVQACPQTVPGPTLEPGVFDQRLRACSKTASSTWRILYHQSITGSAFTSVALPLIGAVGAISAGWLSDTLIEWRQARVCAWIWNARPRSK